MAAIGLGLYLPMILEAHHSTNANFTEDIVSVEGTVERVRFVNPHASLLIKHVDPYFEIAAPSTAGNATMDPYGVAAGAHVCSICYQCFEDERARAAHANSRQFIEHASERQGQGVSSERGATATRV